MLFGLVAFLACAASVLAIEPIWWWAMAQPRPYAKMFQADPAMKGVRPAPPREGEPAPGTREKDARRE
jgi:hypothetical protein